MCIVAKRQRESTCAILYQDQHEEELEWLDEDLLDTTGLTVPAQSTVESGTPVLSVEERTVVWTNQ